MKKINEAFLELGIELPSEPTPYFREYLQDSLEYFELLSILDLPDGDYKTFGDLLKCMK